MMDGFVHYNRLFATDVKIHHEKKVFEDDACIFKKTYWAFLMKKEK